MRWRRYILVDREPRECPDLLEWARWLENDSNIIVEQTRREDGIFVSTVFLGIDLAKPFGEADGPPVLFETLVRGGPLDREAERYTTYGDAERGHAVMLARIDALLRTEEARR